MTEPTTNKELQAYVDEKIKVYQNDGLDLHKSYSMKNAVASAWLILQDTLDKNKKSVLTTCTKTSIKKTILDMVVQGLNPAKKQCYFIAYGNQLTLQRSYFGTVATAKMFSNIVGVFSNVIYKNDTFKYKIDVETGVKKIVTHEQGFENLGTEIVGAYTIVVTPESQENYLEVMNINQIHAAWNMRRGDGLTKAHKQFPDQMALKTVINRAVKMFVNASTDNSILAESFVRTTDNEYENNGLDKMQEVKVEVKKIQASKHIDINNVKESEPEQTELDIPQNESTPF